MRNVVASHWKLTMTSFDDPLTASQEVANKLNVNRCTVIWLLKQIGKMKKLDKLVPCELTTKQKNHHFEVSSSLILCNINEPFLNKYCDVQQKVRSVMVSTTAGDD